MMRVAALSTYENQPISTGVLLLGTDEDPIGEYPAAERDDLHYTGALASIKSFYRLADGLRTVFLVNRTGRLLDIVDIGRWADHAGPAALRRRAVRADVPRACARHGGRAARLRRAQPAPRDQGLCRRRAGLQLQPRRLAPARPDVEVRAVADRRGQRAPWPSACSARRSTCRTRGRARSSWCCGGRWSRWRSSWPRPTGSTWNWWSRTATPGRRRGATCCTCWRAAP